ncbi:hypothetical protein BHE74_00050409 [Ensete ventricosum]|nr:hypothetical protein BHE74_00050409 [Ensete ventricosum]
MSGRERSQGQKERWSIGDDRGWRLCGEDAEEGSRRRGPAGDGGGERGRVTKEERRGGRGGRSKDEDESCWGGSTGAADEEKEGGGRSTKEEGGGGGLSVRLEGQVGEDGVSEGGGERGIAIVRRREGAPPGRRETHRRPPLHAEEDRRSTHGIGCDWSDKFVHVRRTITTLNGGMGQLSLIELVRLNQFIKYN